MRVATFADALADLAAFKASPSTTWRRRHDAAKQKLVTNRARTLLCFSGLRPAFNSTLDSNQPPTDSARSLQPPTDSALMLEIKSKLIRAQTSTH